MCVVDDRTQDSNLWVLALSYFAQKEENCRQQLVDVLAHILSLFINFAFNALMSVSVSVYIAHNRETSNALCASVRCKQRRLQMLSDAVGWVAGRASGP